MGYENPLIARWRSGGATIGSWLSVSDPVIAEIIASCGFDEVLLDQQHGSIDLGSLPSLLQAVTAGGSVPITRVPWNDPVTIGKSLDLGALAVVVPMVDTPEETARAVAACRYPPLGTRSSGPLRPNLVMRSDSPADWEQVACIVMVETATGLRNVDAIAATPGLEGIYVGPGDLAISLGMSPHRAERSPGEEQAHAGALQAILDACIRRGIVAGIYVGEGRRARGYLEQGFRMVTASIDYSLIEAGSRADLAAARGV